MKPPPRPLRALPLLALALLAAALLAPRCRPPQAEVVIHQPRLGPDVTTRSVPVLVEIRGSADAATLEATLNGEPLALLGGPALFTATVEAGPPLEPRNLLEVTVEAADGRLLRGARLFRHRPPASARRITHRSELVTGPLAHGRVGDWILENGFARYVIQDAPGRDLHSVGAFGGNLIDAELVGRPGRDHFFELQPAVNIETVIHATSVEVVNDGSDGGPAAIRACGPDDLLDYVNPSTQVEQLGFAVPPVTDQTDLPVEGCTEYRLDRDTRALELETTIFNLDDQALGLYVGDYVNGMGALEHWTRTSGGPNAGVGELEATLRTHLLAYLGFGDAAGVDYALVPFPPIPGSPRPASSFTTSGVSFLLHSHSIPFVLQFGLPPVFEVPAGGSASFARSFAVGEGSFSNAVALEAEAKGTVTGTLAGCVTVGGEPAPGARVAVGDLVGGMLLRMESHFVTDEAGCYEGPLPPGDYAVVAAKEGVPYEGGGEAPVLHPVTIERARGARVDVALPDTGRVEVSVAAPGGAPLPARVTVVGLDPSPPRTIQGFIASGLEPQSALFRDRSSDPLPPGVVRVAYAGADGRAAFDLEPGSYELVVSRGTEYSARRIPLELEPGETASLEATLARVLDTPGFVSSDFHVHALNSPDSRISFERRVRQFAGEGVENLVATDHDAHSDLEPTIEALDLEDFLHSTVGEEITTFDYGHFNAYPLGVDPDLPSGGSTDWAGAAPPGEDFPSQGHYSLTPAEIAAAAKAHPRNPPGEPVVQVNHIDSHFGPLRIDTAAVPPASDLDAAEAEAFRLDPSEGYFHPFEALEVWNGMDRAHQSEFLDDRIGIWMNLLDQGILASAVADTDTHGFLNLRTAGARSWTASSTDAPWAIDERELADAVRGGRLVGGQGLYVQARLLATDGSGAVADLTREGSRLLTAPSGEVDLEIAVQAPLWAEYDAIEIYANAETVATGTSGGVPVLYSATPTRTLSAGAMDAGDTFAVQEVEVLPGVEGASRRESLRTVRLDLEEDTWVAVVVRGSDGVSEPLFPVMPWSVDPEANATLADWTDGNLGEAGTLALGFTNALLVDVDGNGLFDAPKAP